MRSGPYTPGESLFVFDVVGPPSTHFGWDEYREAFKQMFSTIAKAYPKLVYYKKHDVGGHFAA